MIFILPKKMFRIEIKNAKHSGILANITISSVDVFKLDFPLSWSEIIFRENASQIIFPKLDKTIMFAPQDSRHNENSLNISSSTSVLRCLIFFFYVDKQCQHQAFISFANNCVWSRVFYPPLKRLTMISCDMVNFMTSESLNKCIN